MFRVSAISNRKVTACGRIAIAVVAAVYPMAVCAENRPIDGIGNNLTDPTLGSANTLLIRGVAPFAYETEYPGDGTGTVMVVEPLRENPRTVSNRVSAQVGSVPNSRMLSDYLWAWGQFVDHDISLSTSSDGAAVNGSKPIAILDPLDPLGPNPIPFTRNNFVIDTEDNVRRQINENTSYIDGSVIYGSDAGRARALRTAGALGSGTGAKLSTSPGNLLRFNTAGLPNKNNSPLPDGQLFLAGDIRANENVLLTSLHTLFVREHNRLVDKITSLPEFNHLDGDEEGQYQLARRIVGSELQVITYNEFLPALLGDRPETPAAADYAYDGSLPASVTQSFAHASYRFGHSTVSPYLLRVRNDGSSETPLSLRHAFTNPNLLASDPVQLDLLLKGAATQLSQEVDNLIVDELRNFLFRAPGSGAGGVDLASLNVQRARDHGLPDFNALRFIYGLNRHTSFDQITSDAVLAEALEDIYNSIIENIDPWVGGLAEDHLPGSSLGEFFHSNIADQFRRLRDGDRLFYLSNDLGLYTDGIPNQDIAKIVDLDQLQLSDIIESNTSITKIQDNVFLVVPGDYDSNGTIGADDYVVWRNTLGSTTDFRANGDNTGTSMDVIDFADYEFWKAQFSAGSASNSHTVPEPAATLLLFQIVLAMQLRRVRPTVGAASRAAPEWSQT
jgi:peroxidase